MKIATLDNGSIDGELIVVSQDGKMAAKASQIAPTFQNALDLWEEKQEALEDLYQKLNSGDLAEAFPLEINKLLSPLPRAYAWLDGSAFIQHVKLVRKARGAELPEDLLRVPLMYQGVSDRFLTPTEDIPQIDESHGTDFEGEVGVITDHIPMGSSPEEAEEKILFFVLINDVSLRGLIPAELKNGFGFLQGKPASSLSPFAITPSELGKAWSNGRINLPLNVKYNDKVFGRANAGEMHFSFGELLAHAARTRDLHRGTILGSGTVSNENPEVGSSCLAEKRMIEKINDGDIKTPFMKVGDTIEMNMLDEDGHDLFGTIKQKVIKSNARDIKSVR
tara:strand:+ start:3033 stop:4037 length:1005 start_codon:yes stop_codon:yes gene_type:complete